MNEYGAQRQVAETVRSGSSLDFVSNKICFNTVSHAPRRNLKERIHKTSNRTRWLRPPYAEAFAHWTASAASRAGGRSEE